MKNTILMLICCAAFGSTAAANTWDVEGVVETCDAFACALAGISVLMPVAGFMTADDAASGPGSTFLDADITDYRLGIEDVALGPSDGMIVSATVTTDAAGEIASGEIVLFGVADGGALGDIPLTATVDLTNSSWRVETDFLGIGLVASGSGFWSLEPDGDDVGSILDNCTLAMNADQRDTDADGIGNACDPDFNQDCLVNFADLNVMELNFFAPGDLVTDLDGDGQTNFADLLIMKTLFFGAPGPSGLPNGCGPS